jgi:FkbH-like protein
VRAVEASNAFPLRTLTREDLGRVASYRAMAAVQAASSDSGTDMEAFLIGLSATAYIESVDASSVDRIVQLVKKTNQFKLNLTTFQESDVLEGAADVVALRLVDRLQDYGIVAIAITEPQGDTLKIRNWVMSCRVFGRRLENVTLEILRGNAAARGCESIEAAHTPTEKNVIIPGILTGLGFQPTDTEGLYLWSVENAPAERHHMNIIDRRSP